MSNFSNVFDIRELCMSDEVRSGEDVTHWGGYQLNPETDEYDLAPYDLEEFRDFLETLKQASTLWNAEEVADEIL